MKAQPIHSEINHLSNYHKVGAVVLMAGKSSRMNAGNKLLCKIPAVDQQSKMRTVAAQSISILFQAGFEDLVVVTGADAREIQEALQEYPVQYVHNSDFEKGMGSSIATAFSVLEYVDAWDGALVMLGDMPFVAIEALQTIRKAALNNPQSIIVPTCEGQRGQPVCFPKEYFGELRQCQGDTGAKHLLEKYQAHVSLLDVDDHSIFWDVDSDALLQLHTRKYRLKEYRSQVPALRVADTAHNRSQKIIYLDWAATSQVPQVVMDAVQESMKRRGNVRRGVHQLTAHSTQQLEEARARLANFIGAQSTEVVLTGGTTHGLNLLVPAIAQQLPKQSVIVLTAIEHHAHLLPWQHWSQQYGLQIKIVQLDSNGRISLPHLQKLMQQYPVRIIGLPLVSNVLGTRQPIEEIVHLTTNRNIRIVVDAAQAVAHFPIDVHQLGVDALLFSGHKIFGPTGTGVLWLREDWLQDVQPVFLGGGAVQEVSYEHYQMRSGVAGFEGGTVNVAGLIGLSRAIAWVEEIGWTAIQEQEEALKELWCAALQECEAVTLLCGSPDIPLFTVVVEGLHAHDLGTLLDFEGVLVRTGHHCTQPYHDSQNIEASTRFSLSFLNTVAESEKALEILRQIIQKMGGR